MAWYKHANFLAKNNHELFDQLYHAGAEAPHSGIYRCHVCGHEAVSTQGHRLPPQGHPPHPNGQPIQWRLIVACQHA